MPIDVEPDSEPDVEAECPNCGGTVAVYLQMVGEDDEEQCIHTATVHLEPTDEQACDAEA